MAQNSESRRENAEDGPGKRVGTSVLRSAVGIGEEGTGRNESGELSTADGVEHKLGR